MVMMVMVMTVIMEMKMMMLNDTQDLSLQCLTSSTFSPGPATPVLLAP